MTAILLGLLAALAWGSADFAARFTGRAQGAVAAVLGVMAAGTAATTLALVAADIPFPTTPSPWGLAYGLFAAAGTWCLYEALRRGPVAVVMPLAGAYPAWALGIMVVFQGLRPSAAAWAAMAVVMAGVWLVARSAGPEDDAPTAAADPRAMPLALAAGLGFALALVAGPPAAALHGDLPALWQARLTGALAMLPLALASRRGRPAPAPRWLALVALQGGLDTLALLALLRAGEGANAAAATVVGSTFGIVAIVLARLVLKEPVSPPQWAGIALTFGGVAALSGLG